jgi:hypothetical protein
MDLGAGLRLRPRVSVSPLWRAPKPNLRLEDRSTRGAQNVSLKAC